MNGHTGHVNAVRFLEQESHDSIQILLSGAADKQIRVWIEDEPKTNRFSCAATVDAHSASINCISCLPGFETFASGSADGTIKTWTYKVISSKVDVQLLQTINLQPRYFPLAVAWHSLNSKANVLAVGGTRSTIQLYKSEDGPSSTFSLVAIFRGHEGWIRSLDIIKETSELDSDLLIASASQDKYIRLWRIHQGVDLPAAAIQDDGSRLGSVEQSLSSKAQRFDCLGMRYIASFEALLLGHEDWVYTAKWFKNDTGLRLLSASADSSLSLWEPEPTSGVWICNTRLGEISVQKGSTTATGSAGGFFSGLWLDGGKSITCLGRTGSWRVWSQNTDHGPWESQLGIGGHIGGVKGIAWAKDGSYLLSTSSDQTTRLHAEWKRGKKRSWHEFARPQIHGYDLNCVDTIGTLQFVSGADEKLLRVFDEPNSTSNLLEKLSIAERKAENRTYEAASVPVLGLSNKAVETSNEPNGETAGDITQRELASPIAPILATDHPPYEDDLARHTLWPEKEKLYGHGYEISAVAASHNGEIIATACKASSIDHAVIRLYETKTWRELSPVLTAHSLTVTCLRFSDDDHFLLSVGRDRQWTIFSRQNKNHLEYVVHTSNPKGHSRMILGAAWAPQTTESESIFATAGRDKTIKIWRLLNDTTQQADCKLVIQADTSVLSVDFLGRISDGNLLLLASGTEAGVVTLSRISIDSWDVISSCDLDQR